MLCVNAPLDFLGVVFVTVTQLWNLKQQGVHLLYVHVLGVVFVTQRLRFYFYLLLSNEISLFCRQCSSNNNNSSSSSNNKNNNSLCNPVNICKNQTQKYLLIVGPIRYVTVYKFYKWEHLLLVFKPQVNM